MAIPPNARAIAQPIDPYDILDFAVSLTQGAADAVPPPILLTGESVASFTLAATPEAAAIGLQIKSDSTYPAPTINGTTLAFWLGVDPSLQGNAVFNGAGVTVGLELSIVTNNTPPRRKQRTLTVTVANQ